MPTDVVFSGWAAGLGGIVPLADTRNALHSVRTQ